MAVGDKRVELAVMVRDVNLEELHWSQWGWWGKRMMVTAWAIKRGPSTLLSGVWNTVPVSARSRNPRKFVFWNRRGPVLLRGKRGVLEHFGPLRNPVISLRWKKAVNLTPIWYLLHSLLLIAYAFPDRHALFHLFHCINLSCRIAPCMGLQKCVITQTHSFVLCPIYEFLSLSWRYLTPLPGAAAWLWSPLGEWVETGDQRASAVRWSSACVWNKMMIAKRKKKNLCEGQD